jgi:hypothetical protein
VDASKDIDAGIGIGDFPKEVLVFGFGTTSNQA